MMSMIVQVMIRMAPSDSGVASPTYLRKKVELVVIQTISPKMRQIGNKAGKSSLDNLAKLIQNIPIKVVDARQNQNRNLD